MMCVCAHMCVCAGFHVSDASFNYEEAAKYCESKSSTLASIYTPEELAVARAVIKAKGIAKAITSATADGTGWKWRDETEYWTYDKFPLKAAPGAAFEHPAVSQSTMKDAVAGPDASVVSVQQPQATLPQHARQDADSSRRPLLPRHVATGEDAGPRPAHAPTQG